MMLFAVGSFACKQGEGGPVSCYLGGAQITKNLRGQ